MEDQKKPTSEEIRFNFLIAAVEVAALIRKAKPDLPNPLPLIFSVKQDKDIQAYVYFLDHIKREKEDILINLSNDEAYLFEKYLKDIQDGIALCQIEKQKFDGIMKLYNEYETLKANKNKKKL